MYTVSNEHLVYELYVEQTAAAGPKAVWVQTIIYSVLLKALVAIQSKEFVFINANTNEWCVIYIYYKRVCNTLMGGAKKQSLHTQAVWTFVIIVEESNDEK